MSSNPSVQKPIPTEILRIETKPASHYKLSKWEEYAKVFASITTPAQIEVYEAASLHLQGRVIDAGSGTGKIAHYLQSNTKVTSK